LAKKRANDNVKLPNSQSNREGAQAKLLPKPLTKGFKMLETGPSPEVLVSDDD